MAYYQSEFDVHVSKQAQLDEAIESLELSAGNQQGRQGRLVLKQSDALSVNRVVSQGLNAQNPKPTCSVKTATGVPFPRWPHSPTL